MAALCCEVLLCLVAGDEGGEESASTLPTPPNLGALSTVASVHLVATKQPLWIATPSDVSGTSNVVPTLAEVLRDALAFHQAQAEAMTGEDEALQQPALKMLVALAKYTTLIPPVGTSDTAESFVRVTSKAMETHPSDGMVARLSCEVLAALRYGIYWEEAPLSSPPQEVQARLPVVVRGVNSELLTSRGLLIGDQLALGGKTMAAVLHAWLPDNYPPAPPSEEEEEEEEEEK